MKVSKPKLRNLLSIAAALALVAAAGEATAQKRVTVQSLVQPLDNPWVVNNVRFQEEVAEALGIDLTVVSDEGNEDSNVAKMRIMIAAQPDGILFDPISEAAGRQDARLLEENKMIGVTEDRLVVPHISEYQGEYVKAQVTQDNEEWGYRTIQNPRRGGSDEDSLDVSAPRHSDPRATLGWLQEIPRRAPGGGHRRGIMGRPAKPRHGRSRHAALLDQVHAG